MKMIFFNQQKIMFPSVTQKKVHASIWRLFSFKTILQLPSLQRSLPIPNGHLIRTTLFCCSLLSPADFPSRRPSTARQWGTTGRRREASPELFNLLQEEAPLPATTRSYLSRLRSFFPNNTASVFIRSDCAGRLCFSNSSSPVLPNWKRKESAAVREKFFVTKVFL